MGNHRLICGDAKDEKAINRLMLDQIADMVFTHFKEEAVTEQLPRIFKNLKNTTKDGGLFFLGINWQRMYEILSAGKSVFDEYKQLCVLPCFDEFLGKIEQLGITQQIMEAWENLKKYFQNFFEAFKPIWENLIAPIKNLFGGENSITTKIKSII